MVDVAAPAAPALSSLRRVEFVQTGDWIISSGRWKAARDDLVAAVAALDCPAIRRPVIKLGHSKDEQPLWTGNPTGQPAIGWIDNLALTNQGHTLVGDFVGMPGWLATPNDQGQTVIASAWPDRSVEGTYDHRCQLGHTHPFVLKAVALLGVTPPGVGTLRSLQDVGALYGVQADSGGGTQVVARFNPDQPRDGHGRWTDELPGVQGVPEQVLGTLTRRVPEAEQPAARQLAADVYRHGRREGAEDLLIDLWDAGGLIDDSVVEWAVARGLPDVRTDTGDTRETTRDAQIDRLTALLGEENAAVDAFEDISDRGAREGLSELLADMWDAGMVDADAVEFAVENNGAADPRRRRGSTRRVEAHLPGRHNQQTHGRRYGPGGTLLRGPRRLVRTTRRQTVRALDRTLAGLAGDESATRPGMTGGPLVDLVRGVRDGVDGGQFTPEQALYLLSGLVFRPDVASNPRLSTALADLTGRLRDGDRRDTPDAPDVAEPTAPDPGRVGPLRRTREPAEVADDLPQQLREAASTDQARELLGGLTAAQLRTVADQVGAAYGSGWRKQQVLDSIVQVVVGFAERRDAIMRGGGGPGLTAGAAMQVAAAGDTQTGAMVALLPSDEDLQRLAVPGGEDANQLHVTLLFLGPAVAYPPEVRERLVAELREVAEVIPPGDADGMALAAFNPNSDRHDTAIVLELGGDGLEDVHGIVAAAVEEVASEAGLILPDQHTPWRPHVTLVYSDDLMNVARLADRAGPVRFDRLRVTFAGENVDIPLSGEGADGLDLDNLTAQDMPEVPDDGQVVAQQSRRITRSDRPLRRYWLRGAGAAKIRWNTPGDWTRCVRQLRRHVRDPKGLCSVYHKEATGVYPGSRFNVGRRNASAPPQEAIMPNPNPTIIHAAAAVSVDDVRTAYYRQAPQQAWIREFHTEPRRLIVANDADGSVARVDFEVADDGEIRFSQPVPVRVEYVEQDGDAEKVAASRMVYASAAESRPTVVTAPPPPPGFQPADPPDVQAAGISNRPWSDFTEADYSPEQWRRATLLDRGEAAGDVDSKQRYALPVREPDGTLNRNGVQAAAGGHGIGAVKGISDELRRETARKIVRLYRQIGDEPPESLLAIAGMSMAAMRGLPGALAAAATDPPETPAAEPGNPSTKEDDMPLSTEVYQRLGLAEDAEADALNAAVLAALDKADAQPDPKQVAAAAAENESLQQKVTLLQEQVENLSKQIAGANAAKQAEVKASVIDEALTKGRIYPADKDKWAERYDKAPDAVADVLASIADGTAVPVTVQGKVGDPWDVAAAALPPEPDWLFSNPEPALVGSDNKED